MSTKAPRFEILSDLQSGTRTVVAAEFVDELERDLAAAKAEVDALRADLTRFTAGGLLNAHMICDQRDKAVADLARERARWEWLENFLLNRGELKQWTDGHVEVRVFRADKWNHETIGTGPTLSAAVDDAMKREAK